MRNVILGSFVGVLLAAALLAACGGAGQDPDLQELKSEVALLQAEVALLRDSEEETRVSLLQVDKDLTHCTQILSPFSRVDNDVYIDGANLHVRNGLGSTQTTNSVGNIILGYNESRGAMPDERTGSHMLVIGITNNYTSFGGIVAGRLQETSGAFSSIIGGAYSTASGDYASVFGGSNGTASGTYASVCGGGDSTASGSHASICGGQLSTASGDYASVSGGRYNDASHDYSTCSGRTNQASASYGDHKP